MCVRTRLILMGGRSHSSWTRTFCGAGKMGGGATFKDVTKSVRNVVHSYTPPRPSTLAGTSVACRAPRTVRTGEIRKSESVIFVTDILLTAHAKQRSRNCVPSCLFSYLMSVEFDFEFSRLFSKCFLNLRNHFLYLPT